jgi:hypothetical protein
MGTLRSQGRTHLHLGRIRPRLGGTLPHLGRTRRSMATLNPVATPADLTRAV